VTFSNIWIKAFTRPTRLVAHVFSAWRLTLFAIRSTKKSNFNLTIMNRQQFSTSNMLFSTGDLMDYEAHVLYDRCVLTGRQRDNFLSGLITGETV